MSADCRFQRTSPMHSTLSSSWGRGLWAFLALVTSAAAAGDDLPLPPSTPPVQTIVVEGKKLEVENRLDRKIYSVASDVQSTFGTLSDILNVIPSVDVDADGGVSLRGDSKVLILIDGKPSTQFSGAAAGENLQSIPAADIERIEMLTNPPAQFKADGAAGVINIITRKKHPEGVAGSVQGSLGSGGRSIVGADGSYQTGPLTVSATAGYRHEYRHRAIESDLTAPDPVAGQLITNRSSTDERIRREVPTLGFSAQYAFNQRQMISGSVSWANRGGLRTYTELNDATDSSGALINSAQRFSSGHDPEIDRDAKLGFTQILGQPGETLDFSLHRSTSNQHEHYDYINDSSVPPAATHYSNLSFQENTGISEFGFDFSLPLSRTRTVRLGYAFERTDYRFTNTGGTVDPVTGDQLVDPGLSNDFKFLRQINAIYGSFQASIGAWSYLAGLRMELTHSDAQQLTDGVAHSNTYFDPFPSLHVDRALSDQSTLSVGASRRITRPDFDNFNPYVDHEYTPNLRAGNPVLRPQFTQSYEIGYGYESRGLALELTGYYRRNTDSVTDVTEYIGNGFSLTTKTNLPKNDSAGLEFSSSGHIVPKLGYSLSGNLFHSQIDSSALGIAGLQSTTGLNVKLKLEYHPTSENSGQVTVTRTDKRLTPQGYVGAIDIVNIGYKHQLKPNLAAIATVSDVFNGQRYRRYASTPTFAQSYQRQVHGRVLYVGLVYSFGSVKKDKQATFEYDQSN